MRQPSPTGTSSTVSCDGCSPLADVRTSAFASLSVTVILPTVMRGSLTSPRLFWSATSHGRPTCLSLSTSCGAKIRSHSAW
jgi:hypothetical protein